MGSRQAESSDPHHRPSHARVRRGGRGRDHVRAGEAAEEGRLFDLTGVPDERIAVRVDTRAVAARKRAAILRHRSRLEEHERIPEPLRWIVLDAGCLVQAFPPRPPGGPVAGELLAGLADAAAGR